MILFSGLLKWLSEVLKLIAIEIEKFAWLFFFYATIIAILVVIIIIFLMIRRK